MNSTETLVTHQQFRWQQSIFKEDTWLRAQGIGTSLSVGFWFQMQSPTRNNLEPFV